MNKELLDKMGQAKAIIYEVENQERIMHQGRNQLFMLQRNCEDLKKKSRFLYFLKMYLLWGLIPLVMGLLPAMVIGMCILSLFIPMQHLDSEHMEYAILIGYLCLWLVYTFVFILWACNRKSKYKKAVKNYQFTESEINKQCTSIIPWCREELQKIAYVPQEYQYSIAIDFFYMVLNNGRAENLKECMNLFEEQVHRWKMESTMVNLQLMQNVTNARLNAMQREVRWAQATANAALIAHLF